MKQTVVTINLPKLIEEIKFRKAIETLGTYQSYEEYLDAMIAVTERAREKDPELPK